MLGGILILIASAFISFMVIDHFKKKYPFSVDGAFLKKLFFYHLLLSFAYYGYVIFNPSDSKGYYAKILMNYRGDTWGSFYGTSTTFIEFLGYPFVVFFGFSYEAVMALFSFIGFLGFIYIYIFFRETIKFRHSFLGFDLLTIICFLPNLHFWSSSFGKGSVIFFGISLFFYGLSKIRSRIIPIIVGGLIIYHVRPHVMLVILVSAAVSFIFSSRGIRISLRMLALSACFIAFFFIYRDVLTLVGIGEDEAFSEGLNLTHRAKELTKATSGVDITSYSLPMQIFTFLYRPLFIDAPGLLGIIVSFENVFYLLITLRLFTSLKGIRFLVTGNFLTKTAFLSFFTVSIALAQIAGNLGLAIRQKSQVMILFMFVILSFLDSESYKRWRSNKLAQMRAQSRAKKVEKL